MSDKTRFNQLGLVVTSASCNRCPTAKTANANLCFRIIVVSLVLHLSMSSVKSHESSHVRNKYAMCKKNCVFEKFFIHASYAFLNLIV